MTAFKLEDIEVTGNTILSKTDVLALCGLETGSELIKIKPADVVSRLSLSPYIKSVSAVRSLPSRLRIVIEERKPVAFVHGRGLNLIDTEGVLIPVPETNYRWDLPFIAGVSEPIGELGSRTISANTLKSVEVLNYLNFMSSPVEDLIGELKIASPNLLQLRLVRGGARVFVSIENYQENLFVLTEYVEKYLNYDALSNIEYLDVRFEDQLIIKEHNG
jgi:cell division protein FtsQ